MDSLVHSLACSLAHSRTLTYNKKQTSNQILKQKRKRNAAAADEVKEEAEKVEDLCVSNVLVLFWALTHRTQRNAMIHRKHFKAKFSWSWMGVFVLFVVRIRIYWRLICKPRYSDYSIIGFILRVNTAHTPKKNFGICSSKTLLYKQLYRPSMCRSHRYNCITCIVTGSANHQPTERKMPYDVDSLIHKMLKLVN